MNCAVKGGTPATLAEERGRRCLRARRNSTALSQAETLLREFEALFLIFDTLNVIAIGRRLLEWLLQVRDESCPEGGGARSGLA